METLDTKAVIKGAKGYAKDPIRGDDRCETKDSVTSDWILHLKKKYARKDSFRPVEIRRQTVDEIL